MLPARVIAIHRARQTSNRRSCACVLVKLCRCKSVSVHACPHALMTELNMQYTRIRICVLRLYKIAIFRAFLWKVDVKICASFDICQMHSWTSHPQILKWTRPCFRIWLSRLDGNCVARTWLTLIGTLQAIDLSWRWKCSSELSMRAK